jgi:hypothetical protein
MADRGPPGGEPARAIEDEPPAFCAEGVESGPDSGPDVIGDDGLGAAWVLSACADLVMRCLGSSKLSLRRAEICSYHLVNKTQAEKEVAVVFSQRTDLARERRRSVNGSCEGGVRE